MSFVCHKCDATFDNKYNLNTHLKRKNPCDIKYTCDTCQKTYKTKRDLKTHMMEECKMAYKCNVCDTIFSTESTLNKHVSSKSCKPRDANVAELKVVVHDHSLKLKEQETKINDQEIRIREQDKRISELEKKINKLSALNIDNITSTHNVSSYNTNCNNRDITNNINLTINNFGKKCVDFLMNDIMFEFIKRLDMKTTDMIPDDYEKFGVKVDTDVDAILDVFSSNKEEDSDDESVESVDDTVPDMRHEKNLFTENNGDDTIRI